MSRKGVLVAALAAITVGGLTYHWMLSPDELQIGDKRADANAQQPSSDKAPQLTMGSADKRIDWVAKGILEHPSKTGTARAIQLVATALEPERPPNERRFLIDSLRELPPADYASAILMAMKRPDLTSKQRTDLIRVLGGAAGYRSDGNRLLEDAKLRTAVLETLREEAHGAPPATEQAVEAVLAYSRVGDVEDVTSLLKKANAQGTLPADEFVRESMFRLGEIRDPAAQLASTRSIVDTAMSGRNDARAFSRDVVTVAISTKDAAENLTADTRTLLESFLREVRPTSPITSGSTVDFGAAVSFANWANTLSVLSSGPDVSPEMSLVRVLARSGVSGEEIASVLVSGRGPAVAAAAMKGNQATSLMGILDERAKAFSPNSAAGEFFTEAKATFSRMAQEPR
jgi:hypothetical protein